MKKHNVILLFCFCFTLLTACTSEAKSGNIDIPAIGKEVVLQEDVSINDTAIEPIYETTDISQKEVVEASTAAETESIEEREALLPVTTPAKLSDNLYDFQISIDGIVYQLPMCYCDFEALGWTYDGDITDTLSVRQYVPLQKWIKDDVAIYTKLANLSTDTAAFSDCMVSGITIDRDMMENCEWKILLPSGIEWGISNADDIKEAYGAPTSDYDGNNYYKMVYQCDFYREIDLYVYKDTNTLQQIDIENLIEPEENIDF